MKPTSIHRILIILILLLTACAPITVHAAQAAGEIDPVMLDALKSASFDLSSVGEELAEITLVDGAWEGVPNQSDAASKPSVRLYPDPDMRWLRWAISPAMAWTNWWLRWRSTPAIWTSSSP